MGSSPLDRDGALVVRVNGHVTRKTKLVGAPAPRFDPGMLSIGQQTGEGAARARRAPFDPGASFFR